MTATSAFSAPAPSPQSDADILVFADVSKTFSPGAKALDSVSLNIKRGEFTVLLGSSGSGKTTLLRAAAGLTDLDGGTVSLNGLSLSGRERKRAQKRTGMVHQDFCLIDNLTVVENVLSGAASVTSWPRVVLKAYPLEAQRKACKLLARVGLTEAQANRRAKELSGGQRQRVGIARALINAPILVLADEPVASLDPRIARETMALLRKMACEEGAGVLCSLHQLDLARQFADRIVGIREGRIVFDGSPRALTPTTLSSIFGTQQDLQSLDQAVA